MKFTLKALSLVLGLGMVTSSASAESLKEQIQTELGFITRVFETGYAPKMWKKQEFGWDLETEHQKQLSALASKDAITARDYRLMVAGLLTSTHDYHVGFTFFATEAATLPFSVFSADGHYYVEYVNTDKLSTDILAPGDEILTWNDKPVSEEAAAVLAQISWGVPSTDQRLAELQMTSRRASRTLEVPQGRVNLTYMHNGKVVPHQFSWEYTPETVAWNGADEMRKPFQLMAEHGGSGLSFRHLKMSWGMWKDFQKDLQPADGAKAAPPNPFSIGGRKTFVPDLGKIIWRSTDDDIFDAYIYKNDAGKLIGYIRITDYGGDNPDNKNEETERFEAFKKLIAKMEDSTDALVLNEVNNPGGSVFYVYALMSVLSPNPITVPQHSITLWPEQVKESIDDSAKIALMKTDADARKEFGDRMDGFPVSYQLAQSMLAFDREVIANWNNKVQLTQPIVLWGVDKVNPDPETNYTKPILVLVNELDFSGGDFFPAILQDNQRAKIFGARTSGAGGYILDVKYPSNLGLEMFSFTGSIAKRLNGQPIENLGVTPDIPYTFTATDMTGGFSDYKDAVNKAVQGLL